MTFIVLMLDKKLEDHASLEPHGQLSTGLNLRLVTIFTILTWSGRNLKFILQKPIDNLTRKYNKKKVKY
jgi:hypothetical protein